MSKATEKMREWDERQTANRRYRNSLSAKFSEQTVTIVKERKKAKKDAHERYLTARAQQRIRDEGTIFILALDTRQTRLDEGEQ